MAIRGQALLLLGLVASQLLGVTVCQTIPDGNPNFISKSSFESRCIAALDLSSGTSNKVVTVPSKPTSPSKKSNDASDGCNAPSVDAAELTRLQGQLGSLAGPALDRDNFNTLYNGGASRFGLLQDQTDCLNQLGTGLQFGRAEVYTGRNLEGLGKNGVETLKAGQLSANVVLPAPNVGTTTPAVLPIGRNIFLAAQESSLGVNLKSIPTDGSSTDAQAFINDAATRAQVALLRGIIAVDIYQRRYGGSADAYSKAYWQEFGTKAKCRVSNLALDKELYTATKNLVGKYLCCLKSRQVGRAPNNG